MGMNRNLNLDGKNKGMMDTAEDISATQDDDIEILPSGQPSSIAHFNIGYREIDLGCGKNKVDGCLGVDQYDHSDADVVFDLEEEIWPLPTSYFYEIYVNHCLEHLDNWKNALKEIYRIAAPGARIIIRVPHASRSVLDPNHKTHFNSGSLEKFCTPGKPQYIGDVDFEVRKEFLHWRHYRARKSYEVVEDYLLNPLGFLIDLFVNNRYLKWFGLRFCYWFSGFDEIYWEVEVKK